MKILKILSLASALFLITSTFVQADVVSSDQMLSVQHTQYQKGQILDMMQSQQVQQKLVALGVDREHAISRINSMTASEIDSLNQQLHEAPAGGIVGTIVTVLVVIAVLDVLGITDVYPFIRPINS